MRKKQGLLAVIALLFIVILGGCGGDTTQSDLETVSYTHLDVYKRQTQSSG